MRKVFVTVCSDVGKTRSNNEDNFVVNTHHNSKSCDLFEEDYKCSLPVVAGVFDGMGGTSNGELASLMCAKETVSLRRLMTNCDDREKTLRKFYAHLNRILLRKQLSLKENLGTTACITVIFKDEIIFSNVGDSTIFLISDGEICQKSIDDNQAQLLLDMKAISKEKAALHPMKNMLTQYLGMGLDADSFEPEPHIEFMDRKRGKSYKIVICSDGVSGSLDESEILEIAEKYNDDVAARLVDTALEKGSKDNATAVVIKIK